MIAHLKRPLNVLPAPFLILVVVGLSLALYATLSGRSSAVIPPHNTPVEDWGVFSAAKYVDKYGEAYAFEIRYPPGWTPRERDFGNSFGVSFISPDYKAPARGLIEEVLDGARIELLVASDEQGSSPTEWYARHFVRDINDNEPNLKTDLRVSEVRNAWVSGKQGIEFDVTGPEGEATAKVFNFGGTVYPFMLISKTQDKDYIEIFNQMITTFEITK